MYNYDQKIYKNKIKYCLEQNDSEYLVIVFSGYTNTPDRKALYNYGQSLQNVKTNKLFILDDFGFDQRGSWYIGENGVYEIKEYVHSLIEYIRSELGIKNCNMVTVGSSKGGFASVYFGLRFDVGYTVIGAPQIFLGKYLANKKNILNGIIGEDKEGMDYLNSLIMNSVKTVDTKYYIVCGNQDYHLQIHINPFIEEMKKHNNGDNIHIELVEGGHGDMWKLYRDKMPVIVDKVVRGIYDPKTVYDIIEEKNMIVSKEIIEVDNILIECTNNTIKTNMINPPKSSKYACYLEKDSIIICKKLYQTTPSFEFDITEPGEYIVTWFIKGAEDKRIDTKVDIKGDKNLPYTTQNKEEVKIIRKKKSILVV